MTASRVPDEWPALPYAEWSDTKKTLQMLTQILGKLRLAIEPQKPEWLAAALYPTARGLTTRPMPWGTASVELTLDFFDHTLSVLMSDGRSHRIPLAPSRCVAEIYEELMADLAQLGIEVEIYTKPQEVPDTTPFPENRHDCAYDPEAVQRFFRVLTAVAGVFDEWRSRFFGKTAEQFWWDSFDLSVIRVSDASGLRERGGAAGARGLGRGDGRVDDGLRRRARLPGSQAGDRRLAAQHLWGCDGARRVGREGAGVHCAAAGSA